MKRTNNSHQEKPYRIAIVCYYLGESPKLGGTKLNLIQLSVNGKD